VTALPVPPPPALVADADATWGPSGGTVSVDAVEGDLVASAAGAEVWRVPLRTLRWCRQRGGRVRVWQGRSLQVRVTPADYRTFTAALDAGGAGRALRRWLARTVYGSGLAVVVVVAALMYSPAFIVAAITAWGLVGWAWGVDE
jgi:hypothetical protein